MVSTIAALAVAVMCATGVTAALADDTSDTPRRIYHHEGWSAAARDTAERTNTSAATSNQNSVNHQGRQISFATHASECGSCHQKEYNEWRYAAGSDITTVGKGTYHALSSTEPMYKALLSSLDPAQQDYCRGCHEAGNPWIVADKINNIPAPRTVNVEEGINCLSCHFDGTRIKEAEETLLCATCHNENTGLVETYTEWRTDYSGGKSCRGCHMKDGSHIFLGFNSPSFVKKAITISEPSLPTTISAGSPFDIGFTLTNSGAGHTVPSDLLRLLRARVSIDDISGNEIFSKESLYYKRRAFSGEDPAETVVIKAGEIKPVEISAVTIASPGIYTVKIELLQDSNRLMPSFNTTAFMGSVYKTIVVQ
jgi:hypothetical protein